MRSEGFYVNEKSTDTSWDRTSDLPICSIAPLPLCYRGLPTWYIISVFFLSSKCSLFHTSNVFGSCIIHTFIQVCQNFKKNNSGAKKLSHLSLFSTSPTDVFHFLGVYNQSHSITLINILTILSRSHIDTLILCSLIFINSPILLKFNCEAPASCCPVVFQPYQLHSVVTLV